VVSLGVLALVVQLAMIYFFNAVHKSGVTWRDGTAVHYVLHLDRMVTPFGLWLRARMTPSLSRVMTWSALATEWTLPVLLLSPFAVRFCRRLAIGLIIGLHVGFGACMNLGNFVPAMIAFSPNLIPGEDWNALARWWARDAQRVRRLERLRAWMSAAITRASAWLTPGRWQRVSEPGPVVRTFLRNLPLVREATVVLFVVVASNQLLDENEAAHRVIDHHNSRAMGAAVTYLNLFQGWSMFAPEVFTSDLNMAVDAITVEGRHVDPFNEAANPRTPMPGAQIPPGMGPNWLYYQYVTRIPWRPAYYHAFQEWILRYPERTGRPGDRIVSMRVYKVEDDSPPPGEQTPRNARATLLFKYPD
jgi:hypothetical protein